MSRPSAAWLCVLCTILLLIGASGSSGAQQQVDLALVLAVDTSGSMDPDELELQRQGYVEAFRSTMLHSAIHNGILGQIAVIYFEWSGPTSQWIVVPWTLVATPEQATAFAERLEDRPSYRSSALGGTSISGAIDFSLYLLTTIPVSAMRQVIDISGDGINDHGRSVTQARDEAVSRGVTINGLPIRLDRSEEALGVSSLEEHYRDCVIGGPGAFIVPVRDRHELIGAIRTKIVREIASGPSQPLIRTVQAEVQWKCEWMTSRHNPSR
jgi:hypothetical protein